MKEVNEALDIDEHVVSLGDCEAVVDEEEEESEFVDSDYEFSEDKEANKEFHLGMQFANREHLKEVIKEYAIVNGKLLKFDKNDKKRVKVLCRGFGNCAFVLYESRVDKEESTFVVKVIHAEQTCGRVNSGIWVGSFHIGQKKLAKKVIQGSYKEQYERLSDYAEQIKKTNLEIL
ncbi:unnamed protein product [Prunus brigantina]